MVTSHSKLKDQALRTSLKRLVKLLMLDLLRIRMMAVSEALVMLSLLLLKMNRRHWNSTVEPYLVIFVLMWLLRGDRPAYTPQSGNGGGNFRSGGGDNKKKFVKGFDASLPEDDIRHALTEHFA